MRRILFLGCALVSLASIPALAYDPPGVLVDTPSAAVTPSTGSYALGNGVGGAVVVPATGSQTGHGYVNRVDLQIIGGAVPTAGFTAFLCAQNPSSSTTTDKVMAIVSATDNCLPVDVTVSRPMNYGVSPVGYDFSTVGDHLMQFDSASGNLWLVLVTQGSFTWPSSGATMKVVLGISAN